MFTLMTALFLAAGPQAEHRIAHADLDLSSRAGRAALTQRIDHAVERICAGEHADTLRLRAEQARCRRLAAAQIAPQRSAAIARHAAAQVARAR